MPIKDASLYVHFKGACDRVITKRHKIMLLVDLYIDMLLHENELCGKYIIENIISEPT